MLDGKGFGFVPDIREKF